MRVVDTFDLRKVREKVGLTQAELAARLNVSQTLVSLVEAHRRAASHEMLDTLLALFELDPTSLPIRSEIPMQDSDYVSELANLGYPGFAHRQTGKPRWNPAQLFLMALSSNSLDRRVAEALPWLLLKYPDADWNWVLQNAKLRDLSNRFGFAVTLALEVAKQKKMRSSEPLTTLEALAERSRLVRQDTFCNEGMTGAEKKWLQSHSSQQAQHWNLLSDLKPEFLDHVG
jgi:transcriptional regulator with XRE-family HTH domain